MRILALSDDRASNAGQALGLAEAVSRRLEMDVDARKLPHRGPLLDVLTTYTPLSPAVKAPPDTALVIGAGRVGAIAAHRIGCSGMPSICIMRPPLPGMRFNALVVPEHDLFLREGAVQTVGGLHALTDQRIKSAGRALSVPRPAAVVLLGGPSGTAAFDAEGEARLVVDLQNLVDRGFHLIGTASRRTPKPLLGRFKDKFPDLSIWDGKGENPYPGLLAHADVIVVTSDSVSMISEALYTGLPVIVSGSGQHAPKLRRFYESIASKLSTSDAEFAPYAPLREADRIAEILIAQGLVR